MLRIGHQGGKCDGGDPDGWTDHAERDAVHREQNHRDRVPPCPYQSQDRRDRQGRAIAIIGTTETVLSLFGTIDSRTVTLDPTQRELVIGDRGQRRQIPITSHPLLIRHQFYDAKHMTLYC
jgi:hypothetical protein